MSGHRVRRVSFNDDDVEIGHADEEPDSDILDSDDSSADSEEDQNGSDTIKQPAAPLVLMPPPRGILKKPMKEGEEESREKHTVTIETEVIMETNEATVEIPEKPKNKLFSWPELRTIDVNFISNNIMCGTTKGNDFKTEDDFKVAILFWKMSSIWVMNILGAVFAAFLMTMAVIYMHEAVVFHTIKIFPWLLAAILNLSVLAASYLKFPSLMKPFRLCLALFRATCLALATITFGYIFVSSLSIYLEYFLPVISLCCISDNAEQFRRAALIMVASGIIYLITGKIASVAAKAYYFMLMKQERRLGTVD